MLLAFEILIAILISVIILFSDINTKDKIGTLLAFTILYAIVLSFSHSFILILIKKLQHVLSSFNILLPFEISLSLTVVITIITFPFISIFGSKPILFGMEGFYKIIAFVFTLLIYIFPVIFLTIAILYNAKVKDLTIIFSTLSFLGVLFLNGKKIYSWIHKNLKEL